VPRKTKRKTKAVKDTPLSLHGVKFEDALLALLHTPPPKSKKKKP
jgi:hypothetical protein